MNTQTMCKQRKLMLIVAAIGVIAMFLPWWSISMGIFGGGSVNGMHNEGIVVFLCFLGAVILSLMGNQATNLDRTAWMLAIIAGSLATLIVFITLLNAPPIGDRGFGLYLALLAAIAIVVIAYSHRAAGETLQSGFDSLKNRFTSPTDATPADGAASTKIINPANDPSKPVV